MDVTDACAWLSTGDLAAPVRHLLGDDATVETWTSRRLTGGSSDALGVWRVSGNATAAAVQRWLVALIPKS